MTTEALHHALGSLEYHDGNNLVYFEDFMVQVLGVEVTQAFRVRVRVKVRVTFTIPVGCCALS